MKIRDKAFILFLLLLNVTTLVLIAEVFFMAEGYPDWMDVVALIGQNPDGDLVLIQVDADGQLTVPFKGLNPDSDLVTVAVDVDGQLYAIMRGASGEDVVVDSSGFLSAILKGMKSDTSLVNIAVDDDGQIIMVPRGSSGNYMLVDSSGFLSAILKGMKSDTSLVNIAVDDDGQIIMVPRGSSGNYMAVDSDGFITAVLKGLWGSTLKTMAVDEDGRIYGYQVDDLDQWGETLLVGNAEQAARLGSPVSWDRRGQVQAVFDFSKGFHGVRQVTAGTGAAIELSPSVWQFGGYSVKLTGGSTSNLWAYIGAYMAVPPSDTFGCAILWSAEPTPDYLEMRMEAVIENVLHQGRVRYDFSNTRLEYRTTGASWISLGTKDLEIANYIFHRMKVVIDVEDNVFVRALLNNTQYDMSAALTTSAAPTTGDYARCEVYVVSDSGQNDVAYIDSLIFTVEE